MVPSLTSSGSPGAPKDFFPKELTYLPYTRASAEFPGGRPSWQPHGDLGPSSLAGMGGAGQDGSGRQAARPWRAGSEFGQRPQSLRAAPALDDRWGRVAVLSSRSE